MNQNKEQEHISLDKELRLLIVWIMNKFDVGEFTIKREDLVEFLNNDDQIEVAITPRGDRIIHIKDWAYKKKLEDIQK